MKIAAGHRVELVAEDVPVVVVSLRTERPARLEEMGCSWTSGARRRGGRRLNVMVLDSFCTANERTLAAA